MINILIDTCSWIDLLSEGNNELLPHIEFWNQNRCINLITHEIIIEEWNKHKEIQKKHFTDSLKTKYKHAREIIRKENLYIPENISPRIENIEDQISLIDKLLHEAILLKTTNDIKAFCSDRTIQPRKAPFHNKLDSTKDAYIIFSSLKYFTENNQDFVFISANKDDFGSPNKLDREIHPEIIMDYQSIKVDYFSDIGRAISDLKKTLPLVLLPADNSVLEDENSNEEVNIDKSKPVLDQIFEYVTIRHKEISFVPIQIFISHFPFKSSSNLYVHYGVFNLTINNQELFDLFKSIDISQNNDIKIVDNRFIANVNDHNVKLKKVLQALSQNLIFEISHGRTHEKISIRYTVESNCNCSKCNFRKFRFVDSFNTLSLYTDDLKDLMEQAYIHYQIGNFIESTRILKLANLEAKNLKQNTSEFISHFNLSKIQIFIRNNYFGENLHHELLNDIKKINLSETLKRCSNKENHKIIESIFNDKFISGPREIIQSSTSKIIDNYYSHLSGGWSSNSEVWILINEYAALESFLNDNFIIYDRFKQFFDLSKIFFEGIFASHAIKDEHSSRLEAFDDWLILQLLNYSNPELINKLFYRYKLEKLRYKESSTNGTSFKDLIDNFFLNNQSLRESFLKVNEENNRAFWDYYNRLFGNIITLVSICDLEIEFIERFTEKLLTYLENEEFINRSNYQNVSDYFRRVGNNLDSELLIRYLNLVISKSQYHNEEYLDVLFDLFNKRKKKIKLDDKQFEKIINIAFEECHLCKEKHSNTFIIPLYHLIEDENFRMEISRKINSILKSSFNFDLFYLSVLFDIVDFEEDQFYLALEYVFPKNNKSSLKSFFSGVKENRHTAVNHIANLIFKINFKINDDFLSRLKELDIYYEWLFDMTNFDYSKFQPSWIGEYKTRYYYKKISENWDVKETIEKFLLHNTDALIEKNYLDIFVIKKWELEN